MFRILIVYQLLITVRGYYDHHHAVCIFSSGTKFLKLWAEIGQNCPACHATEIVETLQDLLSL